MQDFESLGVFDAQTELERRQQEEEDRLYSQLTIERRKRITSLESEIKQEKDKSVKDLVTNFEKKIEKTNKDGLEKESQKIEEIYNRKREEKLKHLLDKLSEEEKIRVSQLIEKHSHEMLFLIAEKLCLSEVNRNIYVIHIKVLFGWGGKKLSVWIIKTSLEWGIWKIIHNAHISFEWGKWQNVQCI